LVLYGDQKVSNDFVGGIGGVTRPPRKGQREKGNKTGGDPPLTLKAHSG